MEFAESTKSTMKKRRYVTVNKVMASVVMFADNVLEAVSQWTTSASVLMGSSWISRLISAALSVVMIEFRRS